MRTPHYSEAEIIAAGKKLTSSRGRNATPIEIQKELGGKGKFSRIRDIWNGCQADKTEGLIAEITLPDQSHTRISAAVLAMQSAMEGIVADEICRMTEQSIRHSAVLVADFENREAKLTKKMHEMEEEISYLYECLDELETQSEPSVIVTESTLEGRTHEQTLSRDERKADRKPNANCISSNHCQNRPRPILNRRVRQVPAKPKRSPGNR
ncbi:hypothetical protein [Sulfitobacter pontiacus]|uniref:hypothetical protein n=1 Tax=Sulfitobacter pontiacus TaxID=60137 RepID=UPI0030EBE64B